VFAQPETTAPTAQPATTTTAPTTGSSTNEKIITANLLALRRQVHALRSEHLSLYRSMTQTLLNNSKDQIFQTLSKQLITHTTHFEQAAKKEQVRYNRIL
jgi:hypothetical protein